MRPQPGRGKARSCSATEVDSAPSPVAGQASVVAAAQPVWAGLAATAITSLVSAGVAVNGLSWIVHEKTASFEARLEAMDAKQEGRAVKLEARLDVFEGNAEVAVRESRCEAVTLKQELKDAIKTSEQKIMDAIKTSEQKVAVISVAMGVIAIGIALKSTGGPGNINEVTRPSLEGAVAAKTS